MLVKLTKTLVKTGCNVTDNIVSSSRAIAYKCPIPDDYKIILISKKSH